MRNQLISESGLRILRNNLTDRKLQSLTILTIKIYPVKPNCYLFNWDELNQYKGENIMKEKVEKALEKVRPMLQADGGDVELVDVQEGIVTVRLKGACGGCPMSQMTLKNGIERILKEEVPEVVSVESAP
jgi:Fe-S cluster biogenesis protein NfuA